MTTKSSVIHYAPLVSPNLNQFQDFFGKENQMTEQDKVEAALDAPSETVAEKVEHMIEEAAAEMTPASGVLLDALRDRIKALIPQLTEAHEQDKTRTTSAPCPSCKRDVEAQNRLGSRVPELVQELAELAK